MSELGYGKIHRVRGAKSAAYQESWLNSRLGKAEQKLRAPSLSELKVQGESAYYDHTRLLLWPRTAKRTWKICAQCMHWEV